MSYLNFEGMPDPHLENWFDILRTIPARNTQAAARGRGIYLNQARTLAAPVSKIIDQRHTGWMNSIQQFFHNKEFSPMMATMASIVLIFSLLLGGTVHAAQESLPNQYLYQVKILSEDLVTDLPLSDTQRLRIELNHSSRRIDELVSLASLETNAPSSLLTRLEQHLDRVIRLTAGMEKESMIGELSQIRQRLEYQIKALNSISQNDPALIRAREMLRVRLDWVDLGLSEPDAYRTQVRNLHRYHQPPHNEGNYGLGPGFDDAQKPGKARYSPTPKAEETLSPGNGYGLGPSPNPDQEKSEGKYGPGPFSSKTPTPGQGYGPGPTSEKESTSYGPGPHSSKTPSPGGEPGNGSDHNPTSDQGSNPKSGDPGDSLNPIQNQGEDSSSEGGPKH